MRTAAASPIYEPAAGTMKRNLDHVIRAHSAARANIEQTDAAAASPSDAVLHRCPEPGCDRQFSRKYTLVEHLKTHTGEKPHACPVRTCSKRFSTSGNLARHKRLHGFIEPLKCPVEGCECTFPSDNKLEKHMKFHYGTDVLVCAVLGCGKTFSTMGNLNRHMKNHHAGVTTLSSGEQPLSPQVATASAPVSRVELLQTESSSLLDESAREGKRDRLDDLASILDEEIDFTEDTGSHFDDAAVVGGSCNGTAAPSQRESDISSALGSSPIQKRRRRTVLDDIVSFQLRHSGC